MFFAVLGSVLCESMEQKQNGAQLRSVLLLKLQLNEASARLLFSIITDGFQLFSRLQIFAFFLN